MAFSLCSSRTKCNAKAWHKLAAVAQAARIRLRPIMMTSVATVAGHFPLTLVTGAGAAARNSIGLVLVGGLTIGTIFTLFIVPALYMLLAKEHHEKSLMDVGWDDTPEDVDLTLLKWRPLSRQTVTATAGKNKSTSDTQAAVPEIS